jgi:hypothetical protein
MTGKPKNISKWGGYRPGSGRKPTYMTTEYQVKKALQKARKKAKETGKTLDDILLEIAYADGVKANVRDQLAAIRLFKDLTQTKTSEQNINVKQTNGPVIRLPEAKPDPALALVNNRIRAKKD